MQRIAIVSVALGIVLIVGGGSAAFAEEAKTQLSAAMILSIVSAPLDTRANAYDLGLKDPAPRAADSVGGEVLADGSVRYGRTVITVRNPCPPSEHFDPPPLPGRGGRR